MRDGLSRLVTRAVAPWLALASVSCGAATGLEVPEVPPACVPGPTALAPRPLDTLLVVDRSESMLERMTMEGVPDARRFNHLRRAVDTLSTQLDATRRGSHVGAMFFPRAIDRHVCEPTNEIWCSVNLDVELPARPNNASMLMSLFDAGNAQGGSPVAAALQVARRWLRNRARAGAARALVLFTDGHSNCNPEPATESCECEDRDPVFLGPPPCTQSEGVRHFYCVDTDRTVGAVAQLADAGIETFVVGVVEADNAQAMGRIGRMLRAATTDGESVGERQRYFSVDDAASAARAVRNVTRCDWILPSWSLASGEPSLTLRGRSAPVTRDRAHRDGWDWIDRAASTIRLYGPSCGESAPSEGTETPTRAPTVERSCPLD